MSPRPVASSWRTTLTTTGRDTWSDVMFVTREAFASDARSAAQVALLTALLAALPSAQVVAIAALIDRLRDGERLAGLVLPLVVVIVVVGLSGPLQAIRAAVDERCMLASAIDLQCRLASVVARLSPSRLANAAVSARIEGHSHAIVDMVSHVYGDTVSGVGSILAAVGVVVTLSFMSPVAAVLVVLAAAPAILAGRYVSRAIGRMWPVLGAVYQRDRYLRETMSRQRSIAELASLGTTHVLADLVSEQQRRVAEVRDAPIAARIRAELAVGACGTLLLGGAVVAVIVGMDFGPAAVAGVYGVIAAMAAASQGSLSIAGVLQFLPETAAVRAFFRDAPAAQRQVVASGAGALTASDLTHRYEGRAEPAVSGVSLRAERGEMVALVGVNGAGKTTTVNAILGLVDATAGAVTVDGRTRSELGEAAWLGQFGLLTQEFGRYEFTVRQTVALGNPADVVSDDAVWSALDAARAADFVRAMPAGLDTQLGGQWGGVGISGGQWQRLALARIYLRDAPIWVLDEPTSAIDAEAEQEVFAELGRTRADRITLVVSHRAWTLRSMDRIYVVDEGVVVQCGTYDELMRSPGRFSEIFAAQD